MPRGGRGQSWGGVPSTSSPPSGEQVGARGRLVAASCPNLPLPRAHTVSLTQRAPPPTSIPTPTTPASRREATALAESRSKLGFNLSAGWTGSWKGYKNGKAGRGGWQQESEKLDPGWRSEGAEARDSATHAVAAASHSASRQRLPRVPRGPAPTHRILHAESLSELPGKGGFACPRGCPPGLLLQEGKTNKSRDTCETGLCGDLSCSAPAI